MAEHCCRITWAILDDGQAHFDDIKTTLDFKGPDKPVFPQSFLIDILCKVRYAIPVECANFPDKWKQNLQTATDDTGGSTTGSGSGQLWGRERPASQGMGQGSGDCHPTAGLLNNSGVRRRRGTHPLWVRPTGGMVAILSRRGIPGRAISGRKLSPGRTISPGQAANHP
jgi:hypothetical protein